MADLSPLTAEELLEELADVDRILADALAGDGFTYFGIAVKAGALMLQRDDLKKDLAEARERLARAWNEADLVAEDEEELANARLIAAAPDLLDVLKRLSSFEFHHQGIAEGPLATIIRQAKTAIAKAEGRA